MPLLQRAKERSQQSSCSPRTRSRSHGLLDQTGVVRPRPRRAAPRRDRSRRPVTEGDPAFLITEVRGIPATTVLGCADLRMLPAQFPGATALTSLAVVSHHARRPADRRRAGVRRRPRSPSRVRAAPGSVVARRARVSQCLVLGRRLGGDRGGRGGLRPRRSRLLAAGVSGLILGWGARPWLQQKKVPAGITKLVIVADRRPAEGELSGDGKPLAELHDRDYRRACDRWLIRGVEVVVTPDPGELGKHAQRFDAQASRRCASWWPRRYRQCCRRTAGCSSSVCYRNRVRARPRAPGAGVRRSLRF